MSLVNINVSKNTLHHETRNSLLVDKYLCTVHPIVLYISINKLNIFSAKIKIQFILYLTDNIPYCTYLMFTF
jgi:hypothetical protein